MAAAIVEGMTAGPVLIAEPAEPVSRAEVAGYLRIFGPDADGTWVGRTGRAGERYGGLDELASDAAGPPFIPVSGMLVSVSAGAASGRTGQGSPASLLEAADRALYDAKAVGRGVARCRRDQNV